MSKKILTAAGITLALLGGVAMPIHAMAGDEPAQPITTEDHHLTVVRDADTGKLRAPTAEETAQMQQARAAKARNFRASPRPGVQKYHHNGARGARVSEALQEPLSIEAGPDAKAAAAAGSPSTTIKFETE